jgi:hypothetical protein
MQRDMDDMQQHMATMSSDMGKMLQAMEQMQRRMMPATPPAKQPE